MASTLLLRNINRFHGERFLWLSASRRIQQSSTILNCPLNNPVCHSFNIMKRFESSDKKSEQQSPDNGKKNEVELTMKQKLKKAVAEYGSTVIVFHVSISLVSLGACYALVSSGLEVQTLMAPMGISDETAGKIAANAGTFAIAYAVHKVFAPIRIGITLTATPFIVRYLRNVGVLKKPN